MESKINKTTHVVRVAAPRPHRPGCAHARLVGLAWTAALVLGAAIPARAASPPPSVLDPVVTQVAAGGYHGCALTSVGAVLCWGFNNNGQLGDTSHLDRALPTGVDGLGSGVVAVAIGEYHSCALDDAGGVHCWGDNDDGQLGHGNSTDSSVPVPVSGLDHGVLAIAAGTNHSCALMADGSVQCWGANGLGQLGDGTTDPHDTPVGVTGLGQDAVAITAGHGSTCALTVTGGVECWGNGFNGQLGNGTFGYSTQPVPVDGLTHGVVAIDASGGHVCALLQSGEIWCWGFNAQGQLGNGSTSNGEASPVEVVGLGQAAVAISAGGHHSCAVLADASVACWGENDYGELGDGSHGQSSVPVPVTGFVGEAAGISAGIRHSCARSRAGGLQCWGGDGFAQLGNGADGASSNPVQVAGLSAGVAWVDAGYRHTCALTRAGGAKCWGKNTGSGVLGDGSTQDRHTPVDVAGLSSNMRGIDAHYLHACAVDEAGGVVCWGDNADDQLGDGSGSDQHTPVPVLDGGGNPLGGIAAIATGDSHSCALTALHGVRCWGGNVNGQLGDGSNSASATPVAVRDGAGNPFADFASVAAGGHHNCGLSLTGTVRCWGSNFFGQLGDGDGGDSATPVTLVGQTHVALQVAAGLDYACLLNDQGTVRCWGKNGHGQVGGNNNFTIAYVPITVSGLATNMVAVATGHFHACALDAAGAMWCWGRNDYGQLGAGSAGADSAPVAVSGLADGVLQMALGDYHSCAVTGTGALQCWGWNGLGQLGDGTTVDAHVPVTIRAGQSLDFEAPASLGVGQSVDLTALAQASGGGPVAFDSWTAGTCSVVNGVLTALTAHALCGVRAWQAGGSRSSGGSDAPAPGELRIIRIGDRIFTDGFGGPSGRW